MTEKAAPPEIWEATFREKQEMWGLEAAPSAILARDLFRAKGVRSVLIPGMGYGRNAVPFLENGMTVTGIEISQTAIDLARKHLGPDVVIHHGSVTDMPFDSNLYDGIFCYALIHLLEEGERRKLVADCYNQLAPGGVMVFVAISKQAETYGKGRCLGKDRYEVFEGVNMFFYDRDSIQAEFAPAGLQDITEVNEKFPFYVLTCKKDEHRR